MSQSYDTLFKFINMRNQSLFLFVFAVLACCSLSINAELNIVPRPREITELPGRMKISVSPRIYIDPALGISQEIVSMRFKEKGMKPVTVGSEDKAIIIIKHGAETPAHPEGYTLNADKGKISVTACDRNGAIYAIETIAQLITRKNNRYTAANCIIVDWPEYTWRDYMLDEARHFHGIGCVESLLDEMTRLKMNTFHWHLVDDQGWRIQIDAYPNLTKHGSWGDFSKWNRTPAEWKKTYPDKERGYYTKDEIRHIVNYAAERGIRIIPEIEMPGHCHAAVTVYPQLAATCDDGSYDGWDIFDVTKPEFDNFITAVLDEVAELFPSRIIHIGGDEANYTRWKKNKLINDFMTGKGLKSYSDLQLYAINNAAEYLADKGVRIIGWNEITGDNVHNSKDYVEPSTHLCRGTLVQFWDGSPEFAKKAIAKGYDVVNSDRFYTYLDYPYEATSIEKAYSFNPMFEGLSADQKKHVLGTGCQMWNEFTPTDERVYFQTFPRIAACAENGWTPAENKDLNSFRCRIAPIERIWKSKGYLTTQPVYSVSSSDPGK